MNGNKITIEVAALDSEEVFEGLQHTQFTEAQIVANRLVARKGVMPKQINCRTVTLRESAETIDDIRKSLANIGLREVLREETI